MDLTLQEVFFRLGAMLLVAAVHGAALAAAAKLLGDPGPQQDGRLTVNPFAHLDGIGSLGIVVFGFGWIKPVALDPAALRPGRAGLLAVPALGLGATLVFALVLEWLRGPLAVVASGNLPLYGFAFLDAALRLILAFVILNVIPLPPFTGGYALQFLLPQRVPLLRRYHTAFVVTAALFIASGLCARLLSPIAQSVARALWGA